MSLPTLVSHPVLKPLSILLLLTTSSTLVAASPLTSARESLQGLGSWSGVHEVRLGKGR
ncbi:MAG: hypothetical protein HOL13_08975, partial [Phycisphaerae bacterium]|nr:hypothetical protein [Phycisphaerae bacterium]